MKRIKFLRVAWAGVVAVILVRLFVVQILQHTMWEKTAEKQHVMQNEILAERGKIFMMDDGSPVPVVMNSAVWTIALDPQVVNEEKVVALLETHCKDYLVKNWRDAFKNKKSRYFLVANNVPFQSAEKVKSAKLSGVWLKNSTKRVYPEGEMASGLLGFVNADGVGQYGVEGANNKLLAGENGLLRTVKDVNNVPLTIGNDRVRVPAKNGQDIYLSLDRNIQTAVEKILNESAQKHSASSASAIVMRPHTGEVLAMANVPTYNPADYGKVKDASAYINRITESPYEPASVAKAFAMASAIEEGVMTPETTYNNQGMVTIDGWPIKNAYNGMLGTITMQDALNYSLNTGSIESLRLLGGGDLNTTGRKKLYDYYVNKFGLGRETGIEVFESLGLISSPTEGDGRNSLYANMTFGQNMNVTMIQMISGFSALINGGEWVQPSIIAHNVKNVNANVNSPLSTSSQSTDYQPTKRRVISEKTSKTMRNMLFVTRRGSRMRGEDREGYFVGGKTGTAQVIRDGKYTLDETVATYIGFGGKITEGDRKPTTLEAERAVTACPILSANSGERLG